MIKQFSIGRGDDCQIKIQDNSQKVSRNHATLKVLPNGKIFITDHSSNGTFVNGVKISQSVDYPVRRGDDISFAHVANLNWELIPRAVNKLIYYLAGAIIVVGIAITLYFLLSKPCSSNNEIKKTDTVKVDNRDTVKLKTHKAIKDSVSVDKKGKVSSKTHVNPAKNQKATDKKTKTSAKNNPDGDKHQKNNTNIIY